MQLYPRLHEYTRTRHLLATTPQKVSSSTSAPFLAEFGEDMSGKLDPRFKAVTTPSGTFVLEYVGGAAPAPAAAAGSSKKGAAPGEECTLFG